MEINKLLKSFCSDIEDAKHLKSLQNLQYLIEQKLSGTWNRGNMEIQNC